MEAGKFLEKIEGTTALVKAILTKWPEMRDSDLRLVANVWAHQAEQQEFSLRTNNAGQFLAQFAAGKFTSPETIRRTRQKLEETHPELRGRTYEERRRAGKEVSKNINQ